MNAQPSLAPGRLARCLVSQTPRSVKSCPLTQPQPPETPWVSRSKHTHGLPPARCQGARSVSHPTDGALLCRWLSHRGTQTAKKVGPAEHTPNPTFALPCPLTRTGLTRTPPRTSNMAP